MHSTIYQWIKDQQLSMLNLLEKWVLINSGSENLNGLKLILTALKNDFAFLKPDFVGEVNLPYRHTIDSNGQVHIHESAQALVMKKNPQAPIRVLFAGHMDTVFSTTHPFQKIAKYEDRWIGPGVADMKGGLVVMLKALEAIERFHLCPRMGWEIIISPDEEIGSVSSHQLYVDAARHNHIGVVFEPAFSDGAFVSHRKGSANLTLIVRGKSAHAGRDFHQGRSAIYALASLVQQIEQLNHPSSGITINIGHIHGGGPVNIVPDFAICRINLRTRTSEDMIKTSQGILNIIQKPIEGITTELHEDYHRFPKEINSEMIDLLQQLQETAEQLDIPYQARESGGVCDGNILMNAGLPTLDSMGVVGGNLHTSEEYILLESLVKRTALSVLFLMNLIKKR